MQSSSPVRLNKQMRMIFSGPSLHWSGYRSPNIHLVASRGMYPLCRLFQKLRGIIRFARTGPNQCLVSKRW